MAEKESWEKARRLLVGAVDTVLQNSTQSSEPSVCQLQSPLSTPVNQPQPAPKIVNSKPSAYEEHRRLFGYQPSKVYTGRSSTSKSKVKKKACMWTKEVVCLKECDQDTSPTTEEKIQLAQLNLGCKKLVFGSESDATEVHYTILTAFPILSECGGYTLMRTSDNSRTLVSIEGPDGGITVPFLKDILRQAKLYVRPLQCDIPEDLLKALNKEAKEVLHDSQLTC